MNRSINIRFSRRGGVGWGGERQGTDFLVFIVCVPLGCALGAFRRRFHEFVEPELAKSCLFHPIWDKTNF